MQCRGEAFLRLFCALRQTQMPSTQEGKRMDRMDTVRERLAALEQPTASLQRQTHGFQAVREN